MSRLSQVFEFVVTYKYMLAVDKSVSIARTFWLVWGLADSLGICLGSALGAEINDLLWPTLSWPQGTHCILQLIDNPVPRLIVIGTAIGAIVGVLEYVVLWQRAQQKTAWWIVASVLGWAMALAVKGFLIRFRDIGVSGFLAGAIVGSLQWIVLHRLVHKAGWWVGIRAITGIFVMSAMIPGPSVSECAWFGVVGFVTGCVMGAILQQLLKHLVAPTPQVMQGT